MTYPDVHLTSRELLADWLTANHATSGGVWLVSWRRDELGPRIRYEELIRELLRFGWIDSTVRTIDADRSALRITPRRPGSVWSRPNKQRVTELTEAGLMTESGLAVVERARCDGSWTILDDVEDGIVPPDLAAALAAEAAVDGFESLTPGRRKQLLYWVTMAKRPQTRRDRITRVAQAARDGRSALD